MPVGSADMPVGTAVRKFASKVVVMVAVTTLCLLIELVKDLVQTHAEIELTLHPLQHDVVWDVLASEQRTLIPIRPQR